MYYLYLLVRHKREADEQESLFGIMDDAIERRAEEVEEAKMTGAQVLLAQGRREGRKEGREEGRDEMLREMLLEMLETKFGALSEEVIAKVNALTNRQAKDIVKRVLTTNEVAELGL